MDPIHDLLDIPGVRGAEPSDETVDLVLFRNQEFCEIRTVLPGYSRNEGAFRHLGSTKEKGLFRVHRLRTEVLDGSRNSAVRDYAKWCRPPVASNLSRRIGNPRYAFIAISAFRESVRPSSDARRIKMGWIVAGRLSADLPSLR